MALVETATVVSPDGVDAQVFLNPTGPPAPKRFAPFTPALDLFVEGPAHLAASGPLGAAHALSLLSSLRTTQTRWLGVQRWKIHYDSQELGPSTPFIDTLLGGLHGLTLRELVVDSSAVAVMATHDRFPRLLRVVW